MIRSYLAKHQPISPLSDQDLERMASIAWRQRGWFVIRIDRLTDDWERQIVTNIANKVYGKRESK